MATSLIAAGCGGGGSEKSASTPLTKAEFIARANAICAKEKAGLATKVALFLKKQTHAKPREVLNAEVAHYVLLPAIENETWKIEELGVPAGDKERLSVMLNTEWYAIDHTAVKKLVASIPSVYQPFAASAKLFRSYGLPTCANGPKPPVHIDLTH